MAWTTPQDIPSRAFTCGHCGNVVASSSGWYNPDYDKSWIYVCPHCRKPNYFNQGVQIPGVAPGAEIDHLPAHIAALYREARNCVAASCYTAAVLVARKMLMHIGVAQGAEPNQSFLAYVNHLADKGFIPPNGRGWVDHPRQRGNEANHEIVLMSQADADDLIVFLAMLLKFIYEFPNRVPKSVSAAPAT